MTISLPNDITACLGESEVRGVCPRREQCVRYRGRRSGQAPVSMSSYLCRIPQFAFFWDVYEKACDDSEN